MEGRTEVAQLVDKSGQRWWISMRSRRWIRMRSRWYEAEVVDKYEAESINFLGYTFMKYTHGSHGKIAS